MDKTHSGAQRIYKKQYIGNLCKKLEQAMSFDLLDGFLEYDFIVGADMVKCPHCGADVPCSLFFDDKVKCSECGKVFTKE